MRFPALAPLIRAMILPAVLAVVPAVGWAQSGTLQAPVQAASNTPPKPPVAVPRAPVHKSPPPVVHAQPSAHAQKPQAAALKLAPARPAPPETPVVPAVAPLAPIVKPVETGKPAPDGPILPRFQSLRSNEVNLRSGPGVRYRIDWVYKRVDLPVKVEREFEQWRLIRDADDIQGWVNQATLTARRDFIVKGGDAKLLDDPKDPTSAVAILQPGVIGRIRSCAKDSDWCRVQAAGHTGYLQRTQFFGTLPGEEILP